MAKKKKNNKSTKRRYTRRYNKSDKRRNKVLRKKNTRRRKKMTRRINLRGGAAWEDQVEDRNKAHNYISGNVDGNDENQRLAFEYLTKRDDKDFHRNLVKKWLKSERGPLYLEYNSDGVNHEIMFKKIDKTLDRLRLIHSMFHDKGDYPYNELSIWRYTSENTERKTPRSSHWKGKIDDICESIMVMFDP